MASDLTQDAVLHFLQSSGGSVKNADLLLHFRGFLRDHADKDRNRDLFKKFVNSVATVKQEEGVSYVVLRKRFRGQVSSGGGGVAAKHPENASQRPAGSGEKRRAKPQQRVETPPALPADPAGKTVLPAAGIILTNNNSVETNFNLQHRAVSPPPPTVLRSANSQIKTPAVTLPQLSELPPPAGPRKVGFEPASQPELSLRQDPVLLKVSPRRARNRQSYKTAVSQDDDDEDEEEDQDQEVLENISASVAPFTSSPGLVPVPHSHPPESLLPKIYIQDVAAEPPRVHGPEPGPSRPQAAAGLRPDPVMGGGPDQRSDLSFSSISVFSPSPKTSPSPASPVGPRRNRSQDDLRAPPGGSGGLQVRDLLQQAQSPHRQPAVAPADLKSTAPWHRSADHLHDDQELRPSVSPLHRSTECLRKDAAPLSAGLGWHHSTGDLYDDVSSEGSASSPPLRPGVAKRLSSRLRNRMCRSLGANLDQLLPEEEAGAAGSEAARLNRLHMISSSLSLRYNLSSSSLSSCSTPPRSQSFADLGEALDVKAGRKSLPGAPQGGPVKQSLVPLEAREHAWLVKGAAGAWPDIYSLFREDSSLLNRRDFISGFTVLHWIAKHGDHRVLNTLWYGVEKAGLTLDVNARSMNGHTPLHIAAIHNHKNMLRLLVKKFDADVKLRDTAGKRAWQYLNKAAPADVFQLLGAPARFGKEADGATRDLPGIEPRQQRPRRRRRHYLSTASGERPLTISGANKVKRSSSIAAFLKHRSLGLRLEHKSDSSY